MSRDETGRARPSGAPQRPQRKKLPHDRPRWLRPEDEIFFITLGCNIWYARLVCLMPDHLHALIRFHTSAR